MYDALGVADLVITTDATDLYARALK